MAILTFRTPFDDDTIGDRFAIDCPADPDFATKQSFKDECDVNTVVKRWLTSGVPPVQGNEGIFADVSNIPDYRTCIDFVRSADAQFALLPSDVRERFSNDPAAFLDFVGNPDNGDELVALGLAVPRKPSTGETSAPQDAGAGSPVGGLQAASGSKDAPSGG